jgi:serine O-acetyltransferase
MIHLYLILLIIINIVGYQSLMTYTLNTKWIQTSFKHSLSTSLLKHSISHMIQSDNNITFNRDMTSKLEEIDYITPLWQSIREEARIVAQEDLQASVLISNAILAQNSFEETICNYLAMQLEGPLLLSTQIKNTFMDVIRKNNTISTTWALDLIATALRDSSYPNLVDVLLFSKGFHALAAYRVANSLWYSNREELARYFQSLISRTFGADIHPACKIGKGCYVAAGSHIVIGETASVGDDCSFKQGVTLGGTGKEHGDRHPKVKNNVYFSESCTILGNIVIDEGCIITPESVVTKPAPPYSLLSGVPAKVIKQLSSEEVKNMKQMIRDVVNVSPNTPFNDVYVKFCNEYLGELRSKIY